MTNLEGAWEVRYDWGFRSCHLKYARMIGGLELLCGVVLESMASEEA